MAKPSILRSNTPSCRWILFLPPITLALAIALGHAITTTTTIMTANTISLVFLVSAAIATLATFAAGAIAEATTSLATLLVPCWLPRLPT